MNKESLGLSAEQLPGSHPDLQRAALRDVLVLISECTAEQTRVVEEHRDALARCQETGARTAADVEQRHEELLGGIEQQYQALLATIASQYQADMSKLGETEGSARRKMDSELTIAQQDVKHKLGEAEWMAMSLFEAAQNKLRQDAKSAKKQLAVDLSQLDAIERRAAGLAQFHGVEWVPVEEKPAGAEGFGTPEAAASAFDAGRDAAEQQLAAVEGLALPRLCAGVVPFLFGLLLCAIAGAIAQVASGRSAPHWVAIGVAVGGTLVAVIVAIQLVRGAARAQLAEGLELVRDELDQARRASRAKGHFAARLRELSREDSLKRRDAEVQEARNRFKPVLDTAGQDFSLKLGSLQSEHERLRAKIEHQRELGRGETEAWHAQNLESEQHRYEDERRRTREHQEQELADIERRCEDARQALEQKWNDGLDRILTALGEKRRAGGRSVRDWNDPAWQAWTPPRDFASAVPFGELQVDLRKFTGDAAGDWVLPDAFAVPALLAFPSEASLLVHTDHAGREASIRAMQSVMARLLTSLPAGRVRFTMIDPIGLGQSFAGFMHLADYDEALVGSRIWTDADHIEARLADLQEHMETVIQKYLRNEFETIDEYNAQAAELAEPYRFLVVCDFPANFTDGAVRRLMSIASTGARCGVYTMVIRDTRQAVPGNVPLDELEAHSVNLVRDAGRFSWRDEVFRRFPLSLDEPPDDAHLTQLLHIVGRHAKESKRVEVPFETISPTEQQCWTSTSASEISVPIGRMGATRLQTMRLGRGVAQHALIAGKTGSGKSTLLHVMVTNLALWYSPDEIELYLIDFKKGVEFKAYATYELPHARAIAVESDREFGLSVLQRVDAEMTRRGEMFRRLGVQDLAAYRAASGRPLPRTLLVIDEFQEFFSEDDRLAQDAGLLLDRLVRQGRAFGVHVLLGSQTIGGTSGLARSTLGQMAVRVALQCNEADSQMILGDNNFAARLLSRPGEAIYNDVGGLVEGNSPFQISWLPDEQREQCLRRVRSRWAARPDGPGPAIVFEGNVPSDIRKNRRLAELLAAAPASAPAAPPAWIGEPVAIKDPTAVTLRRQSGANLLIVGQQEESAAAIVAAAMISLAAQHRPGDASFRVFDGTPADSPLAGALAKVGAALPHEMRLVEYRAAADAIGELADELRRRQESEDAHPPAIYLIVYGVQRYRILRKQEDSFSFSMGDEEKKPAADRQFAELLREGPGVGIHVIAWSDTPAAVERTLDRGSLREFDNRVLFQMSAADSSNLIDSPLANRLGVHRALYYSEEQGVTEKFRPYALPKTEWLAQVQAALEKRA